MADQGVEATDYRQVVCPVTWEAYGFVHQCHYHAGHKTRHHCHCGAHREQDQ